MQDLLGDSPPSHSKQNVRPLADLLRPKKFSDLVGQVLPTTDAMPHSQILWGPPGCGKTSYARLVAKSSGLSVVSLSGVTSTAVQFRDVFQRAESAKMALLVDEIHHLNRSQQDIFLPHLENGNILLLGTTTENPSFALRPALLSRCKVVVFERLSEEALSALLERAETFLGAALPLDQEARAALVRLADGDGRYLLNRVEELLSAAPAETLTATTLGKFLQKRKAVYDRAEGHYNLISALHKSMRGSDVQAALYWLARMLDGGEDPLYILRRVVRFAVEDVGLADPAALTQAMAAQQAYQFLGSPEGELALAQAVIYCATAPKSNAGYAALNAVMDFVKQSGTPPPPKHILNAPTKLMKEQGYNEGYRYDHNYPNAFSGQKFFPDSMPRKEFYHPVDRGFEREIQKRLVWWEHLRQAIKSQGNEKTRGTPSPKKIDP